jgi:hypothetical protein
MNIFAFLFIVGFSVTLLFVFLESRIRKQNRTYTDYIVYSLYVGALIAGLMYLIKSYFVHKVTSTIEGAINKAEDFLIARM